VVSAHARRPPRPRAGLAAGIAALAAVAACTTARHDAGEPPVGATPAVRTDADIVLPLDAVIPTTEQQHTVARALGVLGHACMHRFGLDWPMAQPTAGIPGPRNARRYTILDAAKARVEGYHPVDMINHDKAVLAQDARSRVSPAAQKVWIGGASSHGGRPVPAGGCAGEASRKLHAGVAPVDASLPHKLHWRSFGLMSRDSRVGESFARWSRCMRDKGFGYRDPIAAFEDQRWQGRSISKEEIATALADVGCKAVANVAGMMLAVEAAYQRRMIEHHSAQIAAAKAYYDAELASARRILGT
jgi:hypothetical protein